MGSPCGALHAAARLARAVRSRRPRVGAAGEPSVTAWSAWRGRPPRTWQRRRAGRAEAPSAACGLRVVVGCAAQALAAKRALVRRDSRAEPMMAWASRATRLRGRGLGALLRLRGTPGPRVAIPSLTALPSADLGCSLGGRVREHVPRSGGEAPSHNGTACGEREGWGYGAGACLDVLDTRRMRCVHLNRRQSLE
jgi:hypothetical protein